MGLRFSQFLCEDRGNCCANKPPIFGISWSTGLAMAMGGPHTGRAQMVLLRSNRAELCKVTEGFFFNTIALITHYMRTSRITIFHNLSRTGILASQRGLRPANDETTTKPI